MHIVKPKSVRREAPDRHGVIPRAVNDMRAECGLVFI